MTWQFSFSAAEFADKKKVTRREKFPAREPFSDCEPGSRESRATHDARRARGAAQERQGTHTNARRARNPAPAGSALAGGGLSGGWVHFQCHFGEVD